MSEVRDRVEVELSDTGDPGEQRWRLLQAVTGFLRNASLVQPLLLVLEDLHDADHGSLDLLVHLARNLEGARLLVVGTYRDVEVDRGHPLSSTLAELRRIQTFLRVPLRGLTVDEVHRLYTVLRGHEVSWAQAEAVHRQTEGNPLFIQEVLRYLVEAGLVVRQGDRYVPQIGTGEDIPEGLRDVIGKRLSRLSESTNQVLSVAAVIGRDFRLDVLQRVSSLPEEAVIEALEEATERAVVEVRTGLGAAVAYHFTHAFFRQTLYEELSPPRRIRWHQQVARALEEIHARRLDEHAPELAEHFAHSSDPEDLQKAIHYGELAASRAMSVYAYGEAARHLDQALDVQAVLDPDDKLRRYDLLLALGEALMPVGEPQRVSDEIAPQALALAEQDGDTTRVGRVSRLALEAIHRRLSSTAPSAPAWQKWAELADATAAAGSPERAYADVAMGRLRIVQLRTEDGVILLRRAMGLARDLGDAELFAAAAWQVIRFEMTPRQWREAVALADELLARPRERISVRTHGQILEFCGAALLTKGDRDGAERAWRELAELADRSRDAWLQLMALSYQAVVAALDGRLEAAADLGYRLREQAHELGSPQVGIGMAAARCGTVLPLLGRPAEWRDWLSGSRLATGVNFSLALAHALAGDLEQARRQLQELVVHDGAKLSESGRPRFASDLVSYLTRSLEAAILLEDNALVEVLAAELDQGPAFAEAGAGIICLHRHLGAAAALLGEPEKAVAWYRRAIEACRAGSLSP